MLFRITDKIQKNKNKNKNNKIQKNKEEISECFICYEIILPDKTKPIKLISQKDYVKNCTCNGWIHKNCLDDWYNISKKCPICREIITKKALDIIIIKKENLYIVILKNIYKTIKFFIILSFIYKLYVVVKN